MKQKLRAARQFANPLVAVLLGIALLGCGGDSEDENSVTMPITPDAILAALASTNLVGTGFPWSAGNGPVDALKKWDMPIPVKTNGDGRAERALDRIETKLGRVIFDRTSIASTNDDAVTRGIIVSVSTAFVPPGTTNYAEYCANVSGAPGASAYPNGFVDARGVITARLYVNLDNQYCTATDDIAVHEFGHALGMGAHYDGFGNGAAISQLFWAVLRTMYSDLNPVGASQAAIVPVVE